MLPRGYGVRVDGRLRRVSTDDKRNHELDSLIDIRIAARLEALFTKYSNEGPQSLPKQQFRFEMHHNRGSSQVRVEAFKAQHVRMYGFCSQCDKRPTFFVTASDLAKKQDKADKETLVMAGDLALDIDRFLKSPNAKE